MILFFQCKSGNIIAVGTPSELQKKDIAKLVWLFGEASLFQKSSIEGKFIGPRTGDDNSMEHECCRNYPEYGN